jgi:uncharacterized protein (DUF952 family)
VSTGRESASSGDPATLFHLATVAEWQHARAAGTAYVPAAFAHEGFIHCSYRHQLPGVLERYYAARTDLVVLEIDVVALVDALGREVLVEEASPATGEGFPHLYSPLPPSAVRAVHPRSFAERPGG